MRDLIAIEYAKLKKFHALKIIFGVYMIAVPGWMYFMNLFFQIEPGMRALFTSDNPFDFPHIWSYITYSASFFNVLLAVVVVIVTTNDFQYKTMRQNIIDGMSKRQVIFSKFLLVFFLSIIATLYTFLVGFVIGMLESTTYDWYQNVHLILLYFVQTLGYFSFAFLFSIVVKRPAIAIVSFILYFPVETIVGQIITRDLYQVFPLKVFADLTPIPFFKSILASTKVEGMPVPWVLDTDIRIILSLVYVLLFFLLTYFLLKRKDL
ncbi:ABC-2 family transporter protein [compost metagenome]